MKNKKTGLLFLVILLFGALGKTYGQGQLCLLSTHKYYQAVVINNPGSALSNYQVKLTVNTSTLIGASKMLSSGNDIRFTDASCNNLSYWIESGINTATTVIWVKASSLPAGNTTIYMYYGYSSATAGSDGDATFDFFDDFNGSSVNTSKWNTYKSSSASVTVSGGSATFSNSTAGADVILRTVNSYTNPIVLESNITNNNSYGGGMSLLPNGTFTGGVTLEKYSGYTAALTSLASGNSYNFSVGYANSYSYTNGIWSILWTGTNSATMATPSYSNTWVVGTTVPSSVQPAIGLPAIYWIGATASFSADWIRLRKYAASVPTVSFGTEYPNYNLDLTTSIYNGSFSAITSACNSTAVYVNAKIMGYFPSGLSCVVELSDASGSFSSPTTIGTVSGGTGPFSFSSIYLGGSIPVSIPYGTGYKIRQRSVNTPAFAGTSTNAFTLGSTPTSPNFTINDNIQCDEDDAFTFTGSSSIATGNTAAYSWNYGDATTATGNPVNKSYSTYGTYTVGMKALNSSLAMCSTAVVSKNVTVHPQPTAGIAHGDDCQNNEHLFVGSWASGIAYGYIAGYDWDFGDGNTASGDFQYHKYSTYGNYTVRVIETSDQGCKDTATVSHNAWPTPVVSWTADLACDGKDVQFKSNTTLPSFGGSKLSSYYWEFGDLGQDNDKNPKHLYSSAGNYSVFQRVYTTFGCSDTLRKTVTVNPAVKANFTVTNVCKGVTPTIANLSSVPSGTLTYFWNLGNNTTSTATVPTPSYSQQGNYNIKLIATANTGCKDSSNKDVIIYGLPTAQFASTEVCDNEAVQFTNYSVGNASNNWTFAPGNYSSVTNPSFTYIGDGTWPVKLVVTSVDGCKDSITHDAIVNALPIVNFSTSTPSTCLRLNKYNFSNTSSINSGTMTYSWEFGDNTMASSTNASRIYEKAGSYNVKLSAVSDKGCSSSKTVSNAAVVYPHPVAKFSANNACAGTNIAFTNSSTISSGSISGHAWTFGDASSSASASPSKSYSSAGTYAVQLIETSNQGCKDTTAQNVTAWPNPTVSFTATDECIGVANSFKNGSSVSSGFMASYNWTFGDASSGSDINPIHMYDEEGAYTVNLNASTDKGCTGSATKTVNVWPKPVANFTGTNVCLGLASAFTNTSNISAGSITNNNWDFGDNATAATQNASHNYAAAGVYNVKLEVESDKGCMDHITKPVKVFKQPAAHIGASTYKTNVLEPTVTFTDNSLFGDFSNWNFGFNNRTSTFNYDTCAYTKPGTYMVTLKSTTVDGCESKDTTYIKVDNAFTIFFPNAFSPNGDKLNEGFGAVGVFEGINTYSLNILDGKGRVIFSTTDINKKWNGKIENTGDELPTGNFAWFAEYTDYLGKTHKVNGLVSIRR